MRREAIQRVRRRRRRIRRHSETGAGIGTSALLAAWNAAAYVARIEDERWRRR